MEIQGKITYFAGIVVKINTPYGFEEKNNRIGRYFVAHGL